MSARVILLTGSNGGLGQAIARAFLAESTNNLLWLGVHTRREQADKLAAEAPDRCRVVSLNVIEAASWKSVLETVIATNGRLDVLVNNAGRHADALLANMPVADWDNVVRVNLDGAFHGCQAVLPAMISQRCGRIINISSLSALLAPAGQTNYAAAKAGLVGLTQSLAKEVARMNITVNAICPGFIESEALAGFGPEERKAAQCRIPMRRFGRPEEVAVAVRFLACPEASYITGSILKIDGGIM